jgi:hypothetical protein
MLCWISVLSGCAEIKKSHQYYIDDGLYNAGEGYKSGYAPRSGYTRTTPHKALVTEACYIEANNKAGRDFNADDRARRVYFSQCMLQNGYDADGNYVGIPPK